MIGVNVVLEGTKIGTITDLGGEYSLTFHSSLLSDYRKILFRYIDCYDKLVEIEEVLGDNILVILDYEHEEMEELIIKPTYKYRYETKTGTYYTYEKNFRYKLQSIFYKITKKVANKN